MKRILVAISQVVAALSICALALYLADSGVDFKWITIGLLTLLLFGTVCYRTKDLWENSRYWMTLGGLLVIHCAAAFLLQRNLPMLPGMVYGLIGFTEALLLLALLLFGFNAGRR